MYNEHKQTERQILLIIANKVIVQHNDKQIYGEDVAKAYIEGYSIFSIELPNMLIYKTRKESS